MELTTGATGCEPSNTHKAIQKAGSCWGKKDGKMAARSGGPLPLPGSSEGWPHVCYPTSQVTPFLKRGKQANIS